MKTIIKNLKFIFKPSYWLMNDSYSEEVDEIVNKLLDKYEMTIIENGYEVKLGNAIIWLANRPYGSGTLYETSLRNYRPSRLTIERLFKEFDKIKKSEKSERYQDLIKQFDL